MSEYLAEHAAEIGAAADRVRPYIRRTPSLETDLDPALLLKAECLQVTGSFKVRGAFNALLCLKERDPQLSGVIAVSSGNHAQAVALAARTLAVPAVIVIPSDSTPAKIKATRALGAEVITDGVTFENREDVVRRMSAERNLTLVHPFDDWDVIHGQGTAALELLSDAPEVRAMVAPVGGGGLISGIALAAKARDSNIRIVGVEPELAADAAASLETGQHQKLPAPPQTIADGVRPLSIGQRSFEVIVERRLVDGIVTVSERQIEQATIVAWERLKLVVEPTGALPLAAYLAGKLGTIPASERTALILSGGNADRAVIARLLDSSQ